MGLGMRSCFSGVFCTCLIQSSSRANPFESAQFGRRQMKGRKWLPTSLLHSSIVLLAKILEYKFRIQTGTNFLKSPAFFETLLQPRIGQRMFFFAFAASENTVSRGICHG